MANLHLPQEILQILINLLSKIHIIINFIVQSCSNSYSSSKWYGSDKIFKCMKENFFLGLPTFISFKVGLSPSKKNCFICFNKNRLKIMKNAFDFILKTLFILKLFKFSSWLFGHEEKMCWLERLAYFQNLWHGNLVNKQLQYTSISGKVKETRQWNLVGSI